MKPLSPTAMLNALLFPGIVFVLVLVAVPITMLTNQAAGIMSFLLLPVVALWIWYQSDHTYNIFYDDSFIYLKGVKRQHIIPLSKVRSVKPVTEGMRVSAVTAWKFVIEFEPEVKIDKQIIWQTDRTNHMEDFARIVLRLKDNRASVAH